MMAKTVESLNIFERLSSITHELGFVAKKLDVRLPNGSYKAVGEVDVLEAIKPLEEKFRVYSYPIEREVVESRETVNKSGTVNQFLRLLVTYRFVNLDKTEEYVDIKSLGDGLDAGDKATGKAQTYADKYALLKAYKISTGEDPDQNASEEQKTVKENKSQGTKNTSSKPNEKSKYQIISELIKGSKYTLDTVMKSIAKSFKQEIRINDLTDEQFEYVYSNLQEAINKDNEAK